ncbi:universal stress protein [Streptomyces sp. NPDC013455]|uniref:universal stress protein n=1 Tax=Streptomyces sp. NPDC013455 TaxID=3155605 RepID=UPI0033E6AB64
MTLPLVVGVDGSDACLRAVDWAVDEAARHGLPLRLVYACVWEHYEGTVPATGVERSSEQVLAERIVASAADRAERRNPDVKATTDILPEDAADALVRAGEGAFALVTGSRERGRVKGLLLGSVGLAVASRAHCPVVVVRGDHAGVSGTHGRILLGPEEADTGAEAARFAFREADARDCALDVVRTGHHSAHQTGGGRPRAEEPADARAPASLEDSIDSMIARYPRVRTHRSVHEGPAGRILVHLSAAADLVVVGVRRGTGRLGPRIGKAVPALLHHAQCPVAVVPSGRERL